MQRHLAYSALLVSYYVCLVKQKELTGPMGLLWALALAVVIHVPKS